MNDGHPILPSAAASLHGAATPSLELLEARQQRDALKTLLRAEQSAMADFLVALADFDRRSGWEALGHASPFAFLHVDLKLSNSAAFYRMSAARLLHRFPRLVEPLGDGRLCLSTVAELAKVLTDENLAQVATRFFGRFAREAQELVAELQPRQVPATRVVVTKVESPSAPSRSESAAPQPLFSGGGVTQAHLPLETAQQTHPDVVPLTQLLTSEVANGGGERSQAPRDDIEPLTADLRRLHITVSRQLLKKLETAQAGLSHAIHGATMEQVIDAAVDLLLEKQARARGLAKRPRTTLPVAAPRVAATEAAPGEARQTPPLTLAPTEPPPPRRAQQAGGASGVRGADHGAVRRGSGGGGGVQGARLA